MQINIPFVVGEEVEDVITHRVLTVLGIQYRHGMFGNEDTNWYHCISLNTNEGTKCIKDVKEIEKDYSYLIDANGV